MIRGPVSGPIAEDQVFRCALKLTVLQGWKPAIRDGSLAVPTARNRTEIEVIRLRHELGAP